jgi:hypothetical protein
MGQYYLAIILGEEGQKPEIIRIYMTPFNCGMKLTEHSYLTNNFVNTFESLLAPDGIFYKSRIVWAGDYADNEVGQEENLHQIAFNQPNKDFTTKYQALTLEKNQYIINHTKKQYVDKTKNNYHPLPLLTCEGNGRGGGDYYDSNKDQIGIWARDVISSEKEKPEGYKELIISFK